MISSAPMHLEQCMSPVTQASVTSSLRLSQVACASPFSTGPILTVLVLGPLPEAAPSSKLSGLWLQCHPGTSSQILVLEKV